MCGLRKLSVLCLVFCLGCGSLFAWPWAESSGGMMPTTDTGTQTGSEGQDTGASPEDTSGGGQTRDSLSVALSALEGSVTDLESLKASKDRETELLTGLKAALSDAETVFGLYDERLREDAEDIARLEKEIDRIHFGIGPVLAYRFDETDDFDLGVMLTLRKRSLLFLGGVNMVGVADYFRDGFELKKLGLQLGFIYEF